MSTFRTPQSSRFGSSTRSTMSATKSLRMADLSGSNIGQSNDLFFQSIMDRQGDDSEFATQLAASNMEIDNARYDIQMLMTKAHAYCKNSGLGHTNYNLPSTPPRYGGSRTPRQSKFQVTPTQNGEFFRSTISRDMSAKKGQ